MSEVTKYDFAKEFSKNPGLRFKKLSPGHSGEEFREEIEDNLGLVLSGEDGYHKDVIVSGVNDFFEGCLI
jgi:hypothetical protein